MELMLICNCWLEPGKINKRLQPKTTFHFVWIHKRTLNEMVVTILVNSCTSCENSSIHPFVILPIIIFIIHLELSFILRPSGAAGVCWGLSAAHSGWSRVYVLDMSPVHHRTHIHTYTHHSDSHSQHLQGQFRVSSQRKRHRCHLLIPECESTKTNCYFIAHVQNNLLCLHHFA